MYPSTHGGNLMVIHCARGGVGICDHDVDIWRCFCVGGRLCWSSTVLTMASGHLLGGSCGELDWFWEANGSSMDVESADVVASDMCSSLMFFVMLMAEMMILGEAHDGEVRNPSNVQAWRATLPVLGPRRGCG
ncbi:hypothetical protein Nepgr_023986 [Nepenthes gracilis]|uniref:Uncharacterized protein n=1 Tax=Nepenthes gracilis TaxID=150966 RepID=A0AAD3T1Z4_NEPGR|nr:hypothetical protein Nepgr_023986 [Nepenthes gracilis]